MSTAANTVVGTTMACSFILLGTYLFPSIPQPHVLY